ncbi:hypothetical protein ACOQNP_12055 [Ectopseudomonas khazarica]|uniref:hypothetical protein n=1 Tax=Ectopseudomonas khazarica TaxID=2502979 RepID=UPI003B945596
MLVVEEYCFYIQYFAMRKKLPDFRPVTRGELRRIWAEHPEMRRLVLEVERYRRVMAEIDGLYKSTHEAWRHKVGGNLVALHQLQALMAAERYRGADG